MDIKRLKSHASGRLVETWYEDKPCLAFVPHPLPPDLSMNDMELLLTLSDADRALGELAGLGRTTPNPQLLIRPFIRREAVLSSKIEGTQTGIADLYAYEAGQLSLPGIVSASAVDDAQEVLNYVHTLEYGLEQLKNSPVDLVLIQNMHKRLMKGVRGARVVPGEFRTGQNWIGGATIRSADFVPPPVPEMKEALNSLEKYLLMGHDFQPLVRLAFIHYQFEAIHPFGDGNGRTGRLLLPLLMVHWNLLPEPLLYLSAFFEKRRQEYNDLLLAVSEQGMWHEWIVFFLHGVCEQARDAIKRAKQVQDLQRDWHERLKTLKVPSRLLGLADKLFDTPFITIPDAQGILTTTSYQTAKRSVLRLVEAGILRQLHEEEYGKVFVADEIVTLAD